MNGLLDNWIIGKQPFSGWGFSLIQQSINSTIQSGGEVAEWSIAAVLKTASRFAGRGFESLPLRQPRRGRNGINGLLDQLDKCMNRFVENGWGIGGLRQQSINPLIH